MRNRNKDEEISKDYQMIWGKNRNNWSKKLKSMDRVQEQIWEMWKCLEPTLELVCNGRYRLLRIHQAPETAQHKTVSPNVNEGL